MILGNLCLSLRMLCKILYIDVLIVCRRSFFSYGTKVFMQLLIMGTWAYLHLQIYFHFKRAKLTAGADATDIITN